MAGNYPDVPAPRMAYDRDGSLGCTIDNSNVVHPQDAAWLQNLNNENDGDNIGRPGWVCIIFPELRDIKGYFFAGYFINDAFGHFGPIETSVDSTTGLDGTWVSHGDPAPGAGGYTTVPDYRTRIVDVDWPGIKAIKVYCYNGYDAHMNAWHLYGEISTGELPDRLRLWHPTLDQALDDPAVSPDGAYFDWGNTPQGTSATRQFRIKNNSSTMTAAAPVISFDVLTAAPVPDAMTVSDDGTTFSTSITLADLGPGDISPVCTLKRTTPSDATLSIWVQRMIAAATSWS